MLPIWMTKPESIFWIALWLTSPLWTWLVGWIVRSVMSFHASRTESTARASLVYLRKSLQNPPTLLESLAYIVCALPVPIAVAMVTVTLYFFPSTPPYPHPIPAVHVIVSFVIFIFFLCCYLVFGVLTVHGIIVAFRLRHGESRYADNYKAETQKRIDKLTKKFPRLNEG
jgi:hypothetical protein